MADRKSILLRLDPSVHDALARWAAAELRSTNAQIEFLLRRALSDSGRLPDHVGDLPRRGRPRLDPPPEDEPAVDDEPATDERPAVEDRSAVEDQPAAEDRSAVEDQSEGDGDAEDAAT